MSAAHLLSCDELLWRDGVLVVRITSAVFRHCLGRLLRMGYVGNPGGLADARYITISSDTIEVAGERMPAVAALKPSYDPSGTPVEYVTWA